MKELKKFILESKRIPVNILVTRAQPITNGHIKCAERVWKTYKVPTVICMVDTTKVDDRHPFLTSLLWNTYKKLVKSRDCLIDIIKVKNADVVKIGEELGAKGYSVKYWTCGTDRYDAYKKMVDKYVPDVELIEIKRDDKDVSATEVRQAIAADHKERFEELVPQEIYPLYDKLKESMDNI